MTDISPVVTYDVTPRGLFVYQDGKQILHAALDADLERILTGILWAGQRKIGDADITPIRMRLVAAAAGLLSAREAESA